MPELPEVETVRRGLEPAFTNQIIARAETLREGLRFPFPNAFAERITGRTILAVRRRGKFLLIDLSDDETLISHLGMSGSFRVMDRGVNDRAPGRHEHVILTMDSGQDVRYRDPRRFGFMDLWPTNGLASHPMLARLGPEPLDDAFDGERLFAALAGRRTPVKTALLDQTVVAGVGNIYACEALFLAGISPRRLASSLGAKRSARLADAIKSVLRDAIASGGSSLRDHIRTDGELGYFQHLFAVYDHEGEPCPGCTCGGVVKRIVQSGRSSFYCPMRQR